MSFTVLNMMLAETDLHEINYVYLRLHENGRLSIMFSKTMCPGELRWPDILSSRGHVEGIFMYSAV